MLVLRKDRHGPEAADRLAASLHLREAEAGTDHVLTVEAAEADRSLITLLIVIILLMELHLVIRGRASTGNAGMVELLVMGRRDRDTGGVLVGALNRGTEKKIRRNGLRRAHFGITILIDV
jgi:hypothetical protein